MEIYNRKQLGIFFCLKFEFFFLFILKKGRDPETNTECVGCGPVQENFIGCSDIAILGDGTEIEEVTTTTTTTTTTSRPTTTSSSTTRATTETSTTISKIETTVLLSTTDDPFYIEEFTATPTPEMTSLFIPVGTTEFSEIDDDSYEIEVSTTTAIDSSKIPGGSCRVRYEFGTKINIARIVEIYCNRMCNIRCKVILSEYERSVRRVVSLDVIACLETCPALCDCP